MAERLIPRDQLPCAQGECPAGLTFGPDICYEQSESLAFLPQPTTERVQPTEGDCPPDLLSKVVARELAYRAYREETSDAA